MMIDITSNVLKWIELQPSKEELIMDELTVLQPSVHPRATSNPNFIRREATVAAFFAQLQDVRVILVRGTPASGKTTLSLLLHDLQVFWKVWDGSVRIQGSCYGWDSGVIPWLRLRRVWLVARTLVHSQGLSLFPCSSIHQSINHSYHTFHQKDIKLTGCIGRTRWRLW